jgi:hypothetical protein
VDRIIYRDEKRSRIEQFKIPTMNAEADMMHRFYEALTDIKYGRVERPEWVRLVD